MSIIDWETYSSTGCPNCGSSVCNIITRVHDNTSIVECYCCKTKFVISNILANKPKVLKKVKM